MPQVNNSLSRFTVIMASWQEAQRRHVKQNVHIDITLVSREAAKVFLLAGSLCHLKLHRLRPHAFP